jgi:metal-sulfur cluster biosynthetic enzyme
MTQEDVLNVLSQVEHPAIRYSLIKLGMVTDVKLVGNKVSLVFAFPFPNIPIADMLIQSIALPVKQMNLDLEYTTRVMNDQERQLFLQLETEAWKG